MRSAADEITFARTQDLELVRALITAPGCWEAATDDASVARDAFTPNDHPAIWYVIASDRAGAIALFTLLPRSRALWEIHATRAFGAREAAAARAIAPWAFANLPAERLIAEIPRSNAIAIRQARRAGFVDYGVNPRSFRRGGKLEDLILLGISKE